MVCGMCTCVHVVDGCMWECKGCMYTVLVHIVCRVQVYVTCIVVHAFHLNWSPKGPADYNYEETLTTLRY